MKFEEVLPAYREGRDIEIYCRNSHKWVEISCHGNWMLKTDALKNCEFRIKKEKVKYYPVLCVQDGKYFITYDKHKRLEDCSFVYGDVINKHSVRLITEIPELIEEREE